MSTHNLIPIKDRYAYLWLAIGFALAFFETGRWVVAPIVWLPAIFLIRFMRTQKSAARFLAASGRFYHYHRGGLARHDGAPAYARPHRDPGDDRRDCGPALPGGSYPDCSLAGSRRPLPFRGHAHLSGSSNGRAVPGRRRQPHGQLWGYGLHPIRQSAPDATGFPDRPVGHCLPHCLVSPGGELGLGAQLQLAASAPGCIELWRRSDSGISLRRRAAGPGAPRPKRRR
jgi:hypothetical protein